MVGELNMPQMSMEQPQQEEQSYPYSMMPPNKADILDKIRPDVIVEKVRHNLVGEELIDGVWKRVMIKRFNPLTKQEEEVPLLGERALTPLGAWELSSLMLSVSSQNVALSHLKDTEIKRRTIEICDCAMDMCLKNWESYGIHGIDQFRFVYELIKSNTFITLKQPLNNELKNFIRGTTMEFRTQSNVEQTKPSFFSGLLRARQQR
jgi:hypothetical protein